MDNWEDAAGTRSQEVGLSHDSGFRRKNHDVSSAHKQRGHRDQASRAFEERIRQQQRARERLQQTSEVEEAEEDAEA